MQAPLGAGLRRLGAPERRAYPGLSLQLQGHPKIVSKRFDWCADFLALIHRVNLGGGSLAAGSGSDLEGWQGARFSCRLLFCGLSRGSCREWCGGGLPGQGPLGDDDRVWAGQAAAAGGPRAASSRFIHSCWRCQLSAGAV